MQDKEINQIRQMVINGLYAVCIINGYDKEIFLKLKEKQNELFDNYIENEKIARLLGQKK